MSRQHLLDRVWGYDYDHGSNIVDVYVGYLRNVIALGSEQSGTNVRLWVRDFGQGISLADQKRIFERFAKGSTGRRRSNGAGLGLSIVQAIALAHGGLVELFSRPGGGSTFTIVIPIEPPQEVLCHEPDSHSRR